LADDAEVNRDLAAVRRSNVRALLPELRPSALVLELEALEQSPPR